MSAPILHRMRSPKILNSLVEQLGSKLLTPARGKGNSNRIRWIGSSDENGHLQRLSLQLVFGSTSSEEWAKAETLQSNENTLLSRGESHREYIFNEGKSTPELLRELAQSLITSIEPKSDRFDLGSSLRASTLQNERIIVEYSSPNIAKPFHMGHLRSTVTGHSIYRICKAAGHNVRSMCFLGDWGTQFGVLNAGLERWLPKKQGESLVESVKNQNILSLLNYYIRAAKETTINEEFALETRAFSSKLEQLDSDAFEIWKIVREKTINDLSLVWAQFGIHFDVIQGESDFAIQSDATKAVLTALQSKSLTLTDESGCVYGILPPLKDKTEDRKIPLIKSDGSSLYLLRDMAAAISRKRDYPFDRLIYVVDKAQGYHFSCLFSLLQPLGFPPDSLEHIPFGRVEGMSTRSGNFVLLSDVLQAGLDVMNQARAQSENTKRREDEGITRGLVISALIAHFLKVKRGRDIKFQWEDALRPLGRTGVNLQYNHARLVTLESKLAGVRGEFQPSANALNYDYLQRDQIAHSLLIQLANFEDEFWATYSEMEPNILLNYLFNLSEMSSKAFKQLKIQGEPDQSVANTRLALFWITRRILATGMEALGIQPLNQM